MIRNTLGQRRVGLDFNPSGSTTIDRVKQKTSELIDLVLDIPVGEPSEDDSNDRAIVVAPHDRAEIARLKALAAKAYDEAAMWAVKAAVRSWEAGQIVE